MFQVIVDAHAAYFTFLSGSHVDLANTAYDWPACGVERWMLSLGVVMLNIRDFEGPCNLGMDCSLSWVFREV